MRIAIKPFQGLIPRLSEEILPENAAQTAQNVDMRSGELRPWGGLRPVNDPSKGAPQQSIFRWTPTAGEDADGTISAVAATSPIQVTTSAVHGRTTGERVYIDGTGISSIDGITHTITVVDTDTFSLDGTAAAGTAATGTWAYQNGYWFHWTTDVNVVTSPVAGDAYARLYYTGDGAPRMTYSPIAVTGGTSYPENSYLLGIPDPDNAPSLAATNNYASGAITNAVKINSGAITGASKANPCVITSASHGLTTGDQVYIVEVVGMTELNNSEAPYTVTVVNADSFSLDDEDSTAYTTYTSGGYWYNASLADGPAIKITSASHGLQSGADVLISGVGGMTELNSNEYEITVIDSNSFKLKDVQGYDYTDYTSGGTWVRQYGLEDKSTRVYVYTYVSELAEEGPPSPTVSIDVDPGQNVDLSGMDTGPVGSYNITQKNIYRSDDGGDYLFVAQVAVAVTTYSDTSTLEDIAENDAMPSALWDPPPSDLTGLVALPGGVLAGISGNQVCFSEPYYPHAWPSIYRLAFDYDPVALGATGTSIIVTTEGDPSIITGNDPSNMDPDDLEEGGACLSKRGLVDMGYAIIWPGPTGLMYSSGGVPRVITPDLWTEKEYQALKPESWHAYRYHGRYLCFYDDGTTQAGFIFDPREPTSSLTFITTYATGGFNDPLTGDVYLVVSGKIQRWNADAANPLTMTWKSKAFRAPFPTTMGWMKVIADSYDDLTVKFYADGVLKQTKTVASKAAYRLPAGYRAEVMEVEVTGTDEVKMIVMAQALEEIGA